MTTTATAAPPTARVFCCQRTPTPELLDDSPTFRLERVADLADIDGVGACVALVGEAWADPHRIAELPGHLVVVAVDEAGRRAAEGAGRFFLSLEDAAGPEGVRRLVGCSVAHSIALLGRSENRARAYAAQGELRQLHRIGMALMSERDPDRLLGFILTQARNLTISDAGSLYLVERMDDGSERLHFLRAQNDTLTTAPSPKFSLPLDPTSLAGYVASTGDALVIDDVYEIPEGAPYTFNPSFDRKHGYRAKSMLVVPMKDHRDRVVGVLQLINRKREGGVSVRTEQDAEMHVLPYGRRDVEVVQSLAGQAAVSIENGRLYQDIESLFDGFIKAAVTAIDQRDPTTSGHSVRVTELTVDVARLMNVCREGPFADVSFSPEELRQLRFAGLLHDFGKVGVREELLVKTKKLPPVLHERVRARFVLARQLARNRYLAERAERGDDADLDELRARRDEELALIDRWEAAVEAANEPRVLEGAAAEELGRLAHTTFVTDDGEERPFLEEEELHYLRIRRGTLDDDERRQVESHVELSYSFLLEIPWTDDLSRVAEIVRYHHEKLNGAGYPHGVTGEVIPLETRIMTVCDIFDALTASDRPYKKALPVEEALAILRAEAGEGALDPDIVDLFERSGVYRRVLETDWRDL